jgi:hypothetical protein
MVPIRQGLIVGGGEDIQLERIEIEKIGTEQAPINENKEKLAASDIQNKQNSVLGNRGEGEENKESVDSILGDMDMTTEQLVRLAQVRREEVEKNVNVILDDGPVIVKVDITKMETNERELDDGRIIEEDVYPVTQIHPELGPIQKLLRLSKPKSRQWRKVMDRTKKTTYKITKKGTGFNIRYKFEPYEGT